MLRGKIPSRAKLACALAAALACLVPSHGFTQAQESGGTTLRVDAKGATTPFPHYWEHMFGSGRAVLALREDYRNDMRTVKAATGFNYVRFHGILNDEVGVYSEDAKGNAVYNWSYVDQIYDGLQALGVKPFVEISFMPKQLAADPALVHPFWYHPNSGPPKDYAKWDALITAFGKHLVARYGIDEVASWYFEVWNEPNIDFWQGSPKQPTYFKLYDHTARAIKAVSPRLRIGGPATAQAGWVAPFLKHVSEQHVPVDFVSSHVYGNDTAEDVFGQKDDTAAGTATELVAGPSAKLAAIPMDQMVARAVKKVHDQIKASAMPELPLFFSEFNAVYDNQQAVTDSAYIGPYMATTIKQTAGLIDEMSYWDFSDVFEEQGVIRTPFYGGFGLIAERSIPKAPLNDFALLHRLGDRRLAAEGDVLATRREDGTLALVVWNYGAPEASSKTAKPRRVELELGGVAASAQAIVTMVDDQHGSSVTAFVAMGSPANPTLQQIAQLRAAGAMPAARSMPVKGGKLVLEVPVHGLALIEVH